MKKCLSCLSWPFQKNCQDLRARCQQPQPRCAGELRQEVNSYAKADQSEAAGRCRVRARSGAQGQTRRLSDNPCMLSASWYWYSTGAVTVAHSRADTAGQVTFLCDNWTNIEEEVKNVFELLPISEGLLEKSSTAPALTTTPRTGRGREKWHKNMREHIWRVRVSTGIKRFKIFVVLIFKCIF